MKIAVDAMGGDFGPAVVVEGAVAASREFGLVSVLVGDRAAIEREIGRLGAQDLPLSVGEGEGKGNELTEDAFDQLRGSSLNFIGNVEGRDVYNGHADVVVTDGFTGNVCLKISESLAEMLTAMMREELSRDVVSMAG